MMGAGGDNIAHRNSEIAAAETQRQSETRLERGSACRELCRHTHCATVPPSDLYCGVSHHREGVNI